MLGEATGGGLLHSGALQQLHNTQGFLIAREQWLRAQGVLLTNVFALRPQGNKIETLCHPAGQRPPGYSWPPLKMGHYVDSRYKSEIERLHAEISECSPNLIICLGNIASWAITQKTTIAALRGNTTLSVNICGKQYKTLITYHPSAILQNWSFRAIALADLMKAWREREFPEIRRPKREILINPTIAEAVRWAQETLEAPSRWPILAPDIETSNGQITAIGFARSASEAMVIPFWHRQRPGWHFWEREDDEWHAWEIIRKLLEGPQIKVFQNGLYDLQYITRMGIIPHNCAEDTMLLHHSLMPEMQKGLGFLGSIYTDESSWKIMRNQRTDTEKADE